MSITPEDPPSLTSRALAPGMLVNPLGVDGNVFGWAAGLDHAARVLDAARDAGVDLVSTADHYAGGRSEIMIGNWLATHPDRSTMHVATKVGRHPDAPGLAPESIRAAVDASLERLRTDYLDVLSFDGEDPDVPIEDSLGAVADLIADGKVRVLGESAWSRETIDRVRELAADAELPSFRVGFAEYNLLKRDYVESTIAGLPAESDFSLIAKLPLANGFLTGMFRTVEDIERDSAIYAGASEHFGRKGRKVLSALESLGDELGVSQGVIALAWVLNRPEVTAAVVRVRDAEQFEELLAARELVLSRQHAALLDDVSS